MKLIRSNYTFEAYVYNSSRQQQKPLICQDFMTTCCLDWSPHQVPETFCWQGGSDSRRRGKAASWWRRLRSWTPRTGSYHTRDTIHPQRRLNWNMSAQLLYLTDITISHHLRCHPPDAAIGCTCCLWSVQKGLGRGYFQRYGQSLSAAPRPLTCSPSGHSSGWPRCWVGRSGRSGTCWRLEMSILKGWGDISPDKY